MQIQKINPKNFKSSELDTAIKILNAGGVIVYPTETAYALGGDFQSKKATQKIYKIKHRRANFLLPVIVPNLAMAKKAVRFSRKALDLAQRFWPGPATLVLEVKPKMYEYTKKPGYEFLRPYRNLALRVSSNKIAQTLSKKLNRPIISTSANIHGKDACYTIDDVLSQLEQSSVKPDLILDVGRLPKVKPSTIIKVTGEKLEILRPGPVKLKYQ